jgi:AraC-like DNA-binding protein
MQVRANDCKNNFGVFEDLINQHCSDVNATANKPSEKLVCGGQSIVHGGVGLWEMNLNFGWDLRSQSNTGGAGFVVPLGGGSEVYSESGHYYLKPRTSYLWMSDKPINMRRITSRNGIRYVSVYFERKKFINVFSSVYPFASLKMGESLSCVDLSSSHGSVFDSAATAMVHAVRMKDVMSPKVLELLTEAVIRLMIDQGYPHLREISDKSLAAMLPKHIKIALDYMHANASSVIRMQDIASVCGVSVRAMELGFNTYLNTTPAAHLRKLRLEAARGDLLDPNSSAANIKDVAYKWGFMNGARFSKLYLITYGETPSQTRRQIASLR